MRNDRTVTIALVPAAALIFGLTLSGTANADNTAPAITAFDQAFAATNDYTCKEHVHEV
ncbi:MAG: hypothetical protein JOY69_06810, partial [Candidatus Eremiobacteraeota bacterium]|nr:hypothetical protein [Candidatus Eremiobacteraeota bacterium]